MEFNKRNISKLYVILQEMFSLFDGILIIKLQEWWLKYTGNFERK